MDLETYARGWVDMVPHLRHLTEYASQAKVAVEFGVRGAVSSWAILDGLPPDGVLYGVDIAENCPIPERVSNDPRWHFVVGDSVKVDLPRHADFVMIDSSHEYDQTVLELERASTLTPDVIALHDYLDTRVGRDVSRAVDEFAASNGVYRLETVHSSPWGLAILRRS
jgi:hypothetical protein